MLISKLDYHGIGQIANHCDLEKLEIATNEAEDFDLEGLFCDFWEDIKEHFSDDPLEEPWKTLINGGEFESCGGKTRSLKGIKKIIAYYGYARYIILNSFNDTPSGNVSKTNDFSIPKPLKELEFVADKYRSMGYSEYQKTMAYLCLNKEQFDFESHECKPCGCNGMCGGKTKAKGYGIRGRNVSKRL